MVGEHALAMGVELFGDDADALFLEVVGCGEREGVESAGFGRRRGSLPIAEPARRHAKPKIPWRRRGKNAEIAKASERSEIATSMIIGKNNERSENLEDAVFGGFNRGDVAGQILISKPIAMQVVFPDEVLPNNHQYLFDLFLLVV